MGAIPFQFADIKLMAAKMLKRANEQAQRKLRASEEQANEIEKSACEDGFNKGKAEGFAKGEKGGLAAGEKASREDFRQKTMGVASALHNVLAELDERKVCLQAQAESDLLCLAMEIAKRERCYSVGHTANAGIPMG